MSKGAKGEAGWLTLTEVAAAFGMTKQGFHKEVRPLMAAADIRDPGGNVRIRLRGAIDAYISDRVAKQSPKSDDPLLVGGDSPNLERYRAAAASLKELDLELRQRTHADTRELEDGFMRVAGILRRGIEAQQRRWGNECSDILNDAIDEAIRQFKETLPPIEQDQ